jgi:cobalt/nickel transport system ATP-binding protein
MKESALLFNCASIHYEAHRKPVIAGISFEISAGERVALVGLNGSGKTTLLMASVGLVAHEGEIRVCGVPVSRRTLAEVREKIGFLFNVPEDQLLFPKPIEDIAFGLLRRGVKASTAYERAEELLNKLGLSHLAEFPLHHLSHGQKQRVALAGALIAKPPLLLLDEPTAGLDPPGKNNLAQFLMSRDAAMLVATHDLDFAESLCSRIIVLEKGSVVSDASDTRDVRRIWGIK